jgi:hypothetical protein
MGYNASTMRQKAGTRAVKKYGGSRPEAKGEGKAPIILLLLLQLKPHDHTQGIFL